MARKSDSEPNILNSLMRWELLYLICIGFGILFVLGMLMWVFERKKQPYFQLEAKDALFPSFWWALNLVINGGFEVALPRTPLGRLLGVFMVISSLFVVSLFVANVTAAATVNAIQGSIRSLSDLENRRTGTTLGSTASEFLDGRGISHATFEDYQELIEAFEAKKLDAVFFDGPILTHYVAKDSQGDAEVLTSVFKQEDYGIALSQGSELREPINRILLRLVETGEYAEIAEKWFGKIPEL